MKSAMKQKPKLPPKTTIKLKRTSYEKRREESMRNMVFKTMNPKAKLRPELKEKIVKWIHSFYHLDPRYKILTFFNLVAAEGADNVTDDQVDEEQSYYVMGTNGSSSGPKDKTPSAGTSSPSPSGNRKRENFKVNAHLVSRPSARNIKPSILSLLSRIFNATSILTVWRPCSNDAMRRMMEGTGVGKGLDIKGKSAKKGSLSAFVPFMQIFNEHHKNEIQPITEGADMRIYYKSEELRDHVFKYLVKYKAEGPPKMKKKTKRLMSDTILEESEEDFIDENGIIVSDSEEEDYDDSDHLPRHKDPNSLSYIPENAKLKKFKKFVSTGFYGIECSQRLFWHATVQNADITRVGTGTETGRPSLPGFQDANMKTLKVATSQIPKPTPMPVVLQHKSLDEIMKDLEAKREKANPDEVDNAHPLDGCLDSRHLVMAYEEQGTIKPVVSDFDGFLLGWRREALWFGCNLPRDQEKLMMWCVDRIEEILDDQKKFPKNSDSWTIRWLDVLKKAAAEGFHIDMPEYGFGDPKSTSIMEHAALKLKSTGAVRHGSECFNYQFPQEIDEMFLLISDTLKPVPWKYVNVKDLQAILSQKIAEGFVFPLNPKWILCDPGWKKIYDDLLASDALYADLSKDVWFPPYSGIRERIDEIHKTHPNGFQPCTTPARKHSVDMAKQSNTSGRRQSATNLLRETIDEGLGSELTGNAFADLAQLELDDFVGRNSARAGKRNSFDENVARARDSMTIEEQEEGEHSSSEVRYSTTTTWRTPSKASSNLRQEKRPSYVSHSGSAGSGERHVASNSNRSMGFPDTIASASNKPRRNLFKGVMQSTRDIISKKPGKSRKGDRYLSEEGGLSYASAPDFRSESQKSGISDFSHQPKQSNRKYRQMSDPTGNIDDNILRNTKMASSKEMNKEPRRNFTNWGKIRKNFSNSKK